MVDTHAEASCSATRAWARSRRCLTTIGTALAISAAVFTPVASAHPRAHARGCRDAHASIAAVPHAAVQRAVVCLVNQQRARRQLPRLHQSPRLNRSAQGWTNTMVSQRDFSHGADFATRISAAGFNWQMVGENIAAGYRTPAAVVRAWMASPGHCRNILSPSFADVGTGLSDRKLPGAGGSGTWTQDFGLPMSGHAPSGDWRPADGCPY